MEIVDVNRWTEAAEGAEIDFSELLGEAIRAKREAEASELVRRDVTPEAIEQTPENLKLTWKTTPEQIVRINAGNRAAVDEFYFDNPQRLTYSAYRYMRNNAYLKAVISYEDLLQQFYFDLRTGIVRLRPFDTAIGRAVFTSYGYAAVGGLDELYIYKTAEERGKCQSKAS